MRKCDRSGLLVGIENFENMKRTDQRNVGEFLECRLKGRKGTL